MLAPRESIHCSFHSRPSLESRLRGRFFPAVCIVAMFVAGSESAYGEYRYPLGVDSLETYKSDKFDIDESGVLLSARGRKWATPIYHPTIIARYSIDLYTASIVEGNTALIDRALVQTRYLADTLVNRCDGLPILEYPYPGSYGLEPGWGSAMGQGVAVAALTLLRPFSGMEQHYSEAIDCALVPFEIDVLDGGFLTHLEESGNWYEEYPTAERPRVLNGHIFALSGLWLAAESGSEKAKELFSAGVRAVRDNLASYDAGFTSYYSAATTPGLLSPKRYNRIHVDQLLWLWHVSGDPYFFRYAAKFLSYQNGRLASMSVETPEGTRVDASRILDDRATYHGRVGFSDVPVHVIVDTGSNEPVSRLVVFGYGDSGLCSGVSMYAEYSGQREPVQLIHRSDLSQVHTTGNKVTSIIVFDLAEHRATASYRVTFERPNVAFNKRLVLREVDFHFDQSANAYRRYLELWEKNHWVGDVRELAR